MVSQRDKAKMRRISRDLAAGESNERGTPQQRQAILDHINADRHEHDLSPLDDRAPEEGLYERAKSLGMGRIDR